MPNLPGALVISLDFELVWGVRDLESTGYRKDLMPTRQVVPRLLGMFQKYDIHATWATVGFLFFDSSTEMQTGLPELKPKYENGFLSPYDNLSKEVGENETADPLHFAPSLIRQILNTPHQELGTHTFSHYYCLENGQTVKDFEADLRAAMKAAEKYQCKIESIVFPRNQYSKEYLDVCARNGIKTFRGNESLWFRTPSKRSEHRQWSRRIMRVLDAYLNVSGANAFPQPSDGHPVNVPASRYLRPVSRRLRVIEPLRLNRIKHSMREAAQSGQIFHLWWHPEDFAENLEDNFAFLEKILSEYAALRSSYGMQSLTMGEVGNKAHS